MIKRLPVRDLPDLKRDVLGRKYQIDAAAIDGALRHVRLDGGIELLGDRDATNVPNAAKGRGSVSIIARNDHGDQLTSPVLG